ncbi:hypothetical protein P8452_54988 [Trifolium repens]|nr:hypothetical protein P8452_54988 [Trifolium repens]
MIVIFSILNSTTNCDLVSCRNHEDCQVWGKLHAFCIGPGEIPTCLVMNNAQFTLKCACIGTVTMHNISGL